MDNPLYVGYSEGMEGDDQEFPTPVRQAYQVVQTALLAVYVAIIAIGFIGLIAALLS
jgi:hypothetical protein